jgi:hypothetical protein
MGESCSVYVSNRDLCPLRVLEEQAKGADLRVTPGLRPGAWSAVEVRWPDVRLTLNHRDNADGQLGPHLEGFCAYVWDVVGRQMDGRVWALQDKVLRTRHLLGIVGMPGFDDRATTLIRRFAEANNGLIFRDGSVLDGQGRLYLGRDGDRDEEAVLPEMPSALARKYQSEQELKKRHIPVNRALPASVADEEVVLRPAAEVARRAAVLCVVAARAEGLDPARAVAFLEQGGLWHEATPREQEFLHDPRPGRQDLALFAGRYESLRVLLWALGHLDEPGLPDTPSDVARAARLVLDTPLAELVGKARLRPADEVLDLLDLTYRCHWAVQDARRRNEPPPAGLNPALLPERHHALCWLTCHRDQAWDDVAPDV